MNMLNFHASPVLSGNARHSFARRTQVFENDRLLGRFSFDYSLARLIEIEGDKCFLPSKSPKIAESSFFDRLSRINLSADDVLVLRSIREFEDDFLDRLLIVGYLFVS